MELKTILKLLKLQKIWQNYILTLHSKSTFKTVLNAKFSNSNYRILREAASTLFS